MSEEGRLGRLVGLGPREVLRRLGERIRQRTWLDDEHVWYQLGLPSQHGAPPELDPGLALMSPRGDDLALFGELPTMDAHQARRLVAKGGEPWIVMDGDAPAFACWLYRAAAPMTAARGAWLPLPDGAVVLEDSVAAGRARGRGIAPRAWQMLAQHLHAEGKRALLTKVETRNAPSRRAVTKAGFREIAVMRLRRRGPFTSVAVDVIDREGYGPALRERLHGRRARP